MPGLTGRIRRLGRIAESAPPAPDPVDDLGLAQGSLHLRHVDAGSCNGCEIEISGCFSPVYDAERYGARLVASPRHADGVLVSGVVTRNMASALVDTVNAVPTPRVVIAVGDCACDGGVFSDAYGVVGPADAVVGVDLRVPGCPPEPAQIIDTLRRLTRR
jgi:Ni,Fe-hydrogenase III small subunit